MNKRKASSALLSLLPASLLVVVPVILVITSTANLQLAAATGKDQCGIGSGESTSAQDFGRQNGLDTAANAHDLGGIGHTLGPAASGTCSSH